MRTENETEENIEKVRHALREMKQKFGIELKIEEWNHKEGGLDYRVLKAVVTCKSLDPS